MNDIMVRIMRNEAFTPAEADIYDKIRNLCRDASDFDGLYVLVTAINDVATRRGFNLKMDLARQRVPKSARRPIREFPGTLMEVGPIERELRVCVLSDVPLCGDAYVFFQGAREELHRRGMISPGNNDIMSEAIEAAEALGL